MTGPTAPVNKVPENKNSQFNDIPIPIHNEATHDMTTAHTATIM
jgi:hypothetical protein